MQKYLSQSELASLKDEKQELSVALREVEGGAGQGTGADVDVGRIQKEIKRIDHVIAEGTAPTPRAVEKDRLVKEEEELEGLLAEGMPTRFEMNHPSKNPGAVRKHMAWCDRNNLRSDRWPKGRIYRYIEIQKLLRPFEPKSVENLRKDR